MVLILTYFGLGSIKAITHFMENIGFSGNIRDLRTTQKGILLHIQKYICYFKYGDLLTKKKHLSKHVMDLFDLKTLLIGTHREIAPRAYFAY